MQALFEDIIINYIKQKETSFTNNPFIKNIRIKLENIYQQAAIDQDNFKLDFSVGKGQWSFIPWISLFDKDITTTASKGYYIVYLFRADMSGFYISLNQGWTYYENKYGKKDGKIKIQQVSDAWKKLLKSTTSEFSFDSIDLKCSSKSTSLPEGYELAHIYGKFYSADNIPDNKILINDLRSLMSVYQELKGMMINNSIEQTNNSLIINNELNLLPTYQSDPEETDLDDLLNDSKYTIELIENPIPISYQSSLIIKDDTYKPRKIDFEKKNRKNSKIGFAGEKIVLANEIKYLISNNKQELADKVEHVSITQGDGLGYDILSFDLAGNKKYIEVKTTSGPINQPFYISDNEVTFSKNCMQSFYLYRIYNFKPRNRIADYFQINGNIEDYFELKPINYIAINNKIK